MIPLSLSVSLCACSEVGDSDSEDPQVYESMCNIQAQAGSSETTQNSELGNVLSFSLQCRGSAWSLWITNSNHTICSSSSG